MKSDLGNRIKFDTNRENGASPYIRLVKESFGLTVEEELRGVCNFKFVANFDKGDMVPYIHIIKEFNDEIVFKHIDHQRLRYNGSRSIILSGRINLYEHENRAIRICDGKVTVNCWVWDSTLVPMDDGVELEEIDPDLF